MLSIVVKRQKQVINPELVRSLLYYPTQEKVVYKQIDQLPSLPTRSKLFTYS